MKRTIVWQSSPRDTNEGVKFHYTSPSLTGLSVMPAGPACLALLRAAVSACRAWVTRRTTCERHRAELSSPQRGAPSQPSQPTTTRTVRNRWMHANHEGQRSESQKRGEGSFLKEERRGNGEMRQRRQRERTVLSRVE